MGDQREILKDSSSRKRSGLIARQSLTARVLFFASIWTIVAFATVALIISTLYRASSERAFADLLRAHLNTVIEAVSIGDDGLLQGNPQLGNLKFSQPQSGWVWIIDPIDSGSKINGQGLASPSVSGEVFPLPALFEIGFDEQYIRTYQLQDRNRNSLLVAETEVELDGDGNAVRIRVGGNLDVMEADISAFTQNLVFALVIAGIGTLVINVIVILFGLRPLDHVRSSLEKIRNGEADQLTGDFPREIAPLAGEVNALIDSNKRVVERSRMQVGNLAHSLKTPIAVMLNETCNLPKKHEELFSDQIASMQAQVITYLDRARISAQRGSVLARADVKEALEPLLRVMKKLNPDLNFSLEVNVGQRMIAMEAQDFEEIMGNLIENASRFAESSVVISVDDAENKAFLAVSISDDGEGLDDEQKKQALKRGQRLDETKPGSGLGLSIVSEIVKEYQGEFALSDAELGGLKATLLLPRASS